MNPRVMQFKRVIDVVIGTAAGLCALPLILVTALWIKLDSPGPVFYSQERVGLNRRRRHGAPPNGNERRKHDLGGEVFRIYKLRSMRRDAEKASGPAWAARGDPRITRVGRFIRKTRLDELPQLWNVMHGDMSLVGPRPERPCFHDDLDKNIPYYAERICDVKPGLTGLAQVNLEYDDSMESVKNKLYYDHAYGAALTRFSSALRMDLLILFRTIKVVLTGSGAH
ncbi:MAG: sugar transferase [Candidatus Krumholzibacteriia bacterium]